MLKETFFFLAVVKITLKSLFIGIFILSAYWGCEAASETKHCMSRGRMFSI